MKKTVSLEELVKTCSHSLHEYSGDTKSEEKSDFETKLRDQKLAVIQANVQQNIVLSTYAFTWNANDIPDVHFLTIILIHCLFHMQVSMCWNFFLLNEFKMLVILHSLLRNLAYLFSVYLSVLFVRSKYNNF